MGKVSLLSLSDLMYNISYFLDIFSRIKLQVVSNIDLQILISVLFTLSYLFFYMEK